MIVGEQAHLFDAERAAETRDEAIARVEENVEPEWKLEALRAIYSICRSPWLMFTTDRVWAILDSKQVVIPHEPKAIGAVMKTAQRRRWCKPLDTYKASVRVECHRRPLRVWQTAGALPGWDGES